MMLSEELRKMKPFDDFSVIREKYDALLEIKETVVGKLNKLSSQEIDEMVQQDEQAQFYIQQAFVKERRPGVE